MSSAIETLALAVTPVVAGEVTRPAPPPTCWPDDDNNNIVLQRTAAYYAFLPSSKLTASLVARGAERSSGDVGGEIDQLYGVLSELWLLDEVQVGTWTIPRGDPLEVLILVAPHLWTDLHAELIVDDLRWPAHDDGPYPHARLLAELDARR